MNHGFVKVAAASPRMKLGDPAFNAAEMMEWWSKADRQGALCVIFPELALTGATCGDLFFQEAFQASALEALDSMVRASAQLRCAALVGLPLQAMGRLYNVAVLVAQGKMLCATPRFPRAEQSRWFSRYDGAQRPIGLLGAQLIFGQNIIALPGAVIGVAFDPDGALSLPRGGANLILMPTAVRAEAGELSRLLDSYALASSVGKCAIAWASAGMDESSGEGIYAGDCAVFEAGEVLSRGARYQDGGQMLLADVDISGLNHMRQAAAGFAANATLDGAAASLLPPLYDIDAHFDRVLSTHPFFCDEPSVYEDAFAIQVAALKRRMRHIGTKKIVLAWSGGLDSTESLLVAHRAVLDLGAPPSNVIAVSMPGMATSEHTRGNARSLAELLACDFREIDIRQMCVDQLLAIGHDGVTPDVSYENIQARMRMAIPLTLANLEGALQLSTGDMSEMALGWCTYGGDQMGMYGVNAGIPKTMLQRMVHWHAYEPGNERLRETLLSVLETPISPELTPGKEMQSTETILGPYALHDFFLYHLLVSGASGAKIAFLAKRAFAGQYAQEEIDRTLAIFRRRFAASQFKRVTAPEGPAVLRASLSGKEYILPSDLSSAFA